MVLRHKLKERVEVWFGGEKKQNPRTFIQKTDGGRYQPLEGGRRMHFDYQCVRSGCIYCLLVCTVAFFLTTATQPRAGILSLMAERWLKRLLPRFLSLKFWISWIWSEIGFSKSWSSIYVWRGRRGRGVSVREQLMEQHSTWKDRLERMTISDNPSLPNPPPRQSPVLSTGTSSAQL